MWLTQLQPHSPINSEKYEFEDLSNYTFISFLFMQSPQWLKKTLQETIKFLLRIGGGEIMPATGNGLRQPAFRIISMLFPFRMEWSVQVVNNCSCHSWCLYASMVLPAWKTWNGREGGGIALCDRLECNMCCNHNGPLDRMQNHACQVLRQGPFKTIRPVNGRRVLYVLKDAMKIKCVCFPAIHFFARTSAPIPPFRRALCVKCKTERSDLASIQSVVCRSLDSTFVLAKQGFHVMNQNTAKKNPLSWITGQGFGEIVSRFFCKKDNK